ncbi:curli production assembly protein CsgG [Anopheles sinensis]|uniref:Curli production assembly protein CsgG n=1 Tax=Anopheles sinensis TaxID=74873 RepID=A0A084VVI7_ANOSI|nr:curli production assembly protein CsgG [Anopheles sinensis]
MGYTHNKWCLKNGFSNPLNTTTLGTVTVTCGRRLPALLSNALRTFEFTRTYFAYGVFRLTAGCSERELKRKLPSGSVGNEPWKGVKGPALMGKNQSGAQPSAFVLG